MAKDGFAQDNLYIVALPPAIHSQRSDHPRRQLKINAKLMSYPALLD